MTSRAASDRPDAKSSGTEAVFFDAGFTLIFPTRPVVDIYIEAARAVCPAHCDAKLQEAFHRAWAAGTRDERDDHRSSDEIERARWHRFTLKIAESIPELLPHHRAWLDRLTHTFDSGRGWRLADQAPDLLRALRARGFKVGIVSNWHAGLHRIVSDVGLVELVDFVVCSADVGFRKPHPAIFETALRMSGARASSSVHVGDTWAEDVVGALSVGIMPVHLANDGNRRAGTPHRTIGELSELAALV
jgi:putative hydrolase of the HAD superfamily